MVDWGSEETVIAVFFISRGFRRCTEIASALINARKGNPTHRSASACKGRVANVRPEFKNYNLKDPYTVANGYDLNIVGEWLGHQKNNEGHQINKEALEALLGVKNGEIVNAEVDKIVKDQV